MNRLMNSSDVFSTFVCGNGGALVRLFPACGPTTYETVSVSLVGNGVSACTQPTSLHVDHYREIVSPPRHHEKRSIYIIA